jgi:nucleoid-associated protein YgaU
MSRRSYLVLAAALALAGCNSASKEKISSDDSQNPHYKQAQQDLDGGNPGAAAADYESALAENPKLVQAQYELGVLYGDKLGDPVSSIYHFKRYLELDPSSDKKDQVQEQIDKQGQAFAASLPNAPLTSGAEVKPTAATAALKKQLSDAMHTITQLQTELAQSAKHHGHFSTQWIAGTPSTASGPMLADDTASNAPPAGTPANGAGAASPTPTTVAPAAPPRAVAVDTNAPDVNAAPTTSGTNGAPAAASGPSRTYTVVKGDSLWKIAHKMYPGDTKNGEDKIRDANKEAMSGKFLKPGQVLIIPQ